MPTTSRPCGVGPAAFAWLSRTDDDDPSPHLDRRGGERRRGGHRALRLSVAVGPGRRDPDPHGADPRPADRDGRGQRAVRRRCDPTRCSSSADDRGAAAAARVESPTSRTGPAGRASRCGQSSPPPACEAGHPDGTAIPASAGSDAHAAPEATSAQAAARSEAAAAAASAARPAAAGAPAAGPAATADRTARAASAAGLAAARRRRR